MHKYFIIGGGRQFSHLLLLHSIYAYTVTCPSDIGKYDKYFCLFSTKETKQGYKDPDRRALYADLDPAMPIVPDPQL